jgi:hypothetical protein
MRIEAMDIRTHNLMGIPTTPDIRTEYELMRIATAGKIAST